MDKKHRFLQAVRIVAPDDQFTFEAAQRTPEERLPNFPGAAALEFVVGLARLRGCLISRQPNHPKARRKNRRQREGHQHEGCIVVKTSSEDLVEKAVPIRHPITLQNALRIKIAEYWLAHGQPDEALWELEHLPSKAWNHACAVRVRDAALSALRELNGQAHAE